MIRMIKRYAIYGLLGLCLEVFWTGIGSLLKSNVKMEGKTCVWMFFIYGLAVFLEPVHEKIRNKPVILRGGVYMVLIFIAEYITGFFLRRLLGECPWYYGSNHLSIDGLIALDFIPVWFCGGILFEKVHDFLNNIIILKMH